MTAVAPPLSFQPGHRIGWSSANGSSFGNNMDADDVSKMFGPGPRKTVQRQNSSSSIASAASSTSTISASSAQTNNTSVSSNGDTASWAARKKPTRGLWPPGKAEPATGVTTARSQPVNSSASGPTASSAISALHAPMLPSQQAGNGSAQTNGAMRTQNQGDPPAILHLIPMNGTFERKTITVPYYPEMLRIGRQTNQKTIPSPLNGYFDSKVLSRQHAEVWADRQGRVFIRDVKSSNGTFVNGMRLSQENKESEPRELREQDVLELGIDIVSEDQKTVVHHKVAAKVEHAGIYGQGNDALNFGELDPSAGGGLMAASHQLKRNGSQTSFNGRAPAAIAGQNAMGNAAVGQPSHVRNWLNPITTEHIVKKLNTEMKLAMQQSQELARARQSLEAMLNAGGRPSDKDPKISPDRTRPSPTKAKGDLKAHFSEPPAPPPQAPLPEKPDVARALADPMIQPLLRRSDTAKPMSANNSPTRIDHSGDILRLCEELKLAKGEINSQTERMKSLETQLAQERTARESAEERALRFESGDGQDGTGLLNNGVPESPSSSSAKSTSTDLHVQLIRLQATMDEMKQQMEAYKRRAEVAETERDDARQTLAEMVEAKRAANASGSASRSASKSRRLATKRKDQANGNIPEANGHMLGSHMPHPSSPTAVTLLERAGLEGGQPITPEQAKLLTQLLSQEVLGSLPEQRGGEGENALLHHGRPLSAAAIVVIFGVALMGWINTWPKVDR